MGDPADGGPVLAYGVTERSEASDELSLALEEIEMRGFTVLDSGLPASRLQDYAARLDAIYATQVAAAGGDGNLARIRDQNITRCPLAYDESFLELAVHPTALALARRILGNSVVLLMQNGVVAPAGQKSYQSRWHRDLNYQHWVASRPLAIHVLYCLDAFAEENGGTWFLPGSHLVEQFPSDEYVRRHAQPLTAPAGAMIVANAMTFHRAGDNRTERPRRGVNHVIGRPFIAQQIDIPRMLQGRWSDDASLAPYLGYRWNPPASVNDWRAAKLASSES
jgi:hypothetical protein